MSKGPAGPTTRRELRMPPKPAKVSEPYRYTVDGEKVTLDEIKARCPDVAAKVVQRRVSYGIRTWRDLQRKPGARR